MPQQLAHPPLQPAAADPIQNMASRNPVAGRRRQSLAPIKEQEFVELGMIHDGIWALRRQANGQLNP